MNTTASPYTRNLDHNCTRMMECLSTIVDMLNIGIVAVDIEGRVMFANRAAEELLEYDDVRYRKTRKDRLHSGKAIDRRLRAAISRRERDAGRLSLVPAIDKSLIVQCSPLRSDATGCPGEPATVLFISDPLAKPDVDLRAIARLYQLTSAEARLLGALLNGKQVGEYAKEAGITLNTAKGYLKQLFGKTATRRQSDLMRFILANPLLASVKMRNSDPDE